MSIALLLDMAADGCGARRALSADGDSVSYDALRIWSRGAGSLFARHAGNNVAYVGYNRPEFVVALFGAGYSGKPIAPLNYRLPIEDLRRLAVRTAPCIAIADAEFAPRLSGLDGVTVMESGAFLAASRAEPAVETAAAEDADIAVLLYTSGTTGEPKAGVLRHRHLLAYVLGTVEFAGAQEDEAALISVPPYHIAALSAVLTSIYAGRRIVQLASFDPARWTGTVRTEAVTHAMMVPTMMSRVLDELGDRALPSLRHLSYGGGRMPLPVLERAMQALPDADFVNAYGLTETSSTIALLTPDDHRQAAASQDPRWRRRLGSVGRVSPAVELEIRDEAGQPLPPLTSGDIYVRGEQVSGEYLEKNGAKPDGWFPTRDRGHLDEDGYLFLEGRADDVIVRGGENISPGEIEDVLMMHPAIAEAAAIGIPCEEWGEQVAAVVVARAPCSDEDLKTWVRARLRSTKAPAVIRFAQSLPYNETGKLLRRSLRASFIER